MKKILIVAAIAAFMSGTGFAKGGGHSGGYYTSGARSNSGESHSIRGYVKDDGTYVAPSHATNPNNSKADNWTSKGNTNPYTGKEGTKDPVTGK